MLNEVLKVYGVLADCMFDFLGSFNLASTHECLFSDAAAGLQLRRLENRGSNSAIDLGPSIGVTAMPADLIVRAIEAVQRVRSKVDVAGENEEARKVGGARSFLKSAEGAKVETEVVT